MGRPVVASSESLGGLAARDGENILVRDDPDSFADAVAALMRDPVLASPSHQRDAKRLCRSTLGMLGPTSLTSSVLADGQRPVRHSRSNRSNGLLMRPSATQSSHDAYEDCCCLLSGQHAWQQQPFPAYSQSRHPPAGQPSSGCGDFNYGPIRHWPLGLPDHGCYDTINVVERSHFTPKVERLIGGERGTLAGDIAYTLNAFPNHRRALRSAAELTRRNGGRMPTGMNYSTDMLVRPGHRVPAG